MSGGRGSSALSAAIAVEAGTVPLSVLRERTAALMAAYRGEGPPPPGLLERPGSAAAYAAYRMPATYAAVRHALVEAAAACPALEPANVLDVGGGTGAALWAAAHTFPGLVSATVIDRSAAALTTGRRLAAAGGVPVLASAAWVVGDLTDRGGAPPLPAADLALVAYVLAEVGGPAVEALVGAVARSAGTVVIVEPGTPEGHRTVLVARAALLRAGLEVVAPCPHEARCPLSSGPTWCHVGVRLDRSALHRRLKGASLGHEDEKLSYVVATRSLDHRRAERVVGRPRRRGGAVELQVCSTDGDVEDVRVLERHREAFRAARSLAWGDRWEPGSS